MSVFLTSTDAFQIRKCLGRLSWSQVSYFSESGSTITCHDCPSPCAHCKRAAQVKCSLDFNNLHPAWLRTGVEGPKSSSKQFDVANQILFTWLPPLQVVERDIFYAQQDHEIPWLSRHTSSLNQAHFKVWISPKESLEVGDFHSTHQGPNFNLCGSFPNSCGGTKVSSWDSDLSW